MTSGRVRDVVANLIFLLVAQDGKRGDRGDELIVAKSFAPRDGAGGGTKWKSQRKTQVRIARFGQVQSAGVENERPQPRSAEGELIAESQVHGVIVGGRACQGERALLDQSVVRRVTVCRGAKEPLRAWRWRPVKAHQAKIVAEWHGHAT